jgi:HSP20 family molecular chaperone IbpA
MALTSLSQSLPPLPKRPQSKLDKIEAQFKKGVLKVTLRPG